MRTVIEHKKLRWIDIIEPNNDDIKFLKQEFGFEAPFFEKIIPSMFHPDFDIFSDYISLVLHYPRNEESGEVSIHEIDLIIGKNYIITNRYTNIRPIDLILKECIDSPEKKEEYMGHGAGFLLYVMLDKILKRVVEKTDKINEQIAETERKIFAEEEEQMIKTISYLKRRITSFWRATEPQGEVFYALKTAGVNFLGTEYRHYFSQIFRVYRRIDNSLKTYRETVNSLEETNHSMVNLKRNEIITILTVFSVIMLPLTLVASIWGMNTNFLPFEKTAVDFWLIMVLMICISAGMIIYFKFKKWL